MGTQPTKQKAVLQSSSRGLVNWPHDFGADDRFPFSSGATLLLRSSSWPCAGTCATRFPCVTWRNCSPNVAWKSITRRSGAGYNATLLSWNADCVHIASPPTTPGGWMRPTCESKASGFTSTGRWTSREPRSIFAFRTTRCHRRPALSGAGATRRQPPGTARHQHGQTRGLPTGYPGAQKRGCAARWLRASGGQIPQQHG